MARTVAMMTGAVSSAALEAEYQANWVGLDLSFGDSLPWLFVRAKVTSQTVSVYTRSALGDELDSGAPVWSRHPDGPAVVAAPSPTDGWHQLRYFIGTDVGGVVVHCTAAGTCQLSLNES